MASPPEPVFDATGPVLVTGATGYIAGWLIKRLLERGVRVHAAVRDPGNHSKLSHLRDLADETGGELLFFQADLLVEGSYADAMAGCTVVFHTASPFIARFDDPQRDLVDPALNGTRNVLATVNETDSVQRVVLTSSCAAISGGPADVERAPGGVLTEAQWNSLSSLEDNPYSYSKTLAEQAAWELARAQDRWRLVVINPALVLGAGMTPEHTSASFDYVKMLGDGTCKDGAPRLQLGMVDVRDVAEAHLRAGFLPDASGRHIVFAESLALIDLANHLRDTFGDGFPFPPRAAYDGHAWRADNSRSKAELDIEYRSVWPALDDMFRQLVAEGRVEER